MIPAIRGRIAHFRIDPRTKVLFQITFALAATTHRSTFGIMWLSMLAVFVVAWSRTNPLSVLKNVSVIIPFLVAVPILEAIRLSSPWVDPYAAIEPVWASYQLLLILMVSVAIVQTTAIDEMRAAIQWFLPGRLGEFVGIGSMLVLRMLPLVRTEIQHTRRALGARLGSSLPVRRKVILLVGNTLQRSEYRTDRFSAALQARCVAWNPTHPPLKFHWIDVPVWLLSFSLILIAIFSVFSIEPSLSNISTYGWHIVRVISLFSS